MNTTNVSALALLVGVLCASTAGQAETIRNITGLNYWDEERAFEGYTLFGAQGNATTYLLDMEGNVVHSWPISGNPRLLDNGNLFARDSDGSFHEVDWDGNTLICSDTEGHIFEVTAEGELVWEYINPVTMDGEIVAEMIDAPPMHNPVFRAFRHGADHPAFKGRTLAPMGSIAECND